MTLGADLERAWHSAGVTPADPQADRADADRRDRRPRRGQRARSGDPLARRRPLGSQGQEEPHRPAPLERRRARPSISCACWHVRCRTRRSPRCSIAPARRRGAATAGPNRGSAACAVTTTIATYREGERRERGEVTLDEAAAALSVSPSTVRRLIKDGQLAASQLCKGAPGSSRRPILERRDVKGAATARRLRRPPSGNPLQKTLEL